MYLIISLCLLCGFGMLWGQQPQFIPLNVDYNVFNAKSNEEYVEIDLSFLQKSLAFSKTDSGFIANFTARVEIKEGDAVRYEQTHTFVNNVQNLEEVHPYSELQHAFTCKLPPGKYSSKVTLTDMGSGARGEYLMDVEVEKFPENKPALSDIQLAAKISKAEDDSKFNKNGLKVIPNPSGTFNLIQPMLYYYAEVYNLSFSEDTPGTYTLECFITDKEDSVLRKFPQKKKQKPGSSAVLVGGHNIVTLSSGTYFLNLKFTDDQTGQTIERTQPFRMFKPTKEDLDQAAQFKAVTTKLMQDYYSKFSEEQLDEEFEMVRYISTGEEQKIFKNLDLQSKIQFLVEFWKKRDPDPATPQNEYKIKYFQLAEYASLNFRNKFKEGWKTDRGRVLMVYGPPDEIDRSPAESGKKPYEIWSYNALDGGSMFVFADLRGFGEYELLHSTYRKELNQPGWERQVEVQKDPNNSYDFR